MTLFRRTATHMVASLALCALSTLDVHAEFKQVREKSQKLFGKKKPLVDRSNTAALFLEDNLTGGVYTTVYPYPGTPYPRMTEEAAYQGETSLELTLRADVYSGAGLCLSTPKNLKPYVETGALRMWVKGVKGREIFLVGVLDNGKYGMGRWQQSSTTSRNYGKIKKGEWTELVIPLKDFGDQGSFWDDLTNSRVSSKFNWEAVNCITLDVNKNQFSSFKVFLDNVMIEKKMTAAKTEVDTESPIVPVDSIKGGYINFGGQGRN